MARTLGTVTCLLMICASVFCQNCKSSRICDAKSTVLKCGGEVFCCEGPGVILCRRGKPECDCASEARARRQVVTGSVLPVFPSNFTDACPGTCEGMGWECGHGYDACGRYIDCSRDCPSGTTCDWVNHVCPTRVSSSSDDSTSTSTSTGSSSSSASLTSGRGLSTTEAAAPFVFSTSSPVSTTIVRRGQCGCSDGRNCTGFVFVLYNVSKSGPLLYLIPSFESSEDTDNGRLLGNVTDGRVSLDSVTFGGARCTGVQTGDDAFQLTCANPARTASCSFSLARDGDLNNFEEANSADSPNRSFVLVVATIIAVLTSTATGQ